MAKKTIPKKKVKINISVGTIINILLILFIVYTVFINPSFGRNIVDSVRDNFSLMASQKGLKLSFIIDDNIPDKIIGNPIKLKTIIYSVIETLIQNKNTENLKFDIQIKSCAIPIKKTINNYEVEIYKKNDYEIITKKGSNYKEYNILHPK
jgi:hypothetical protein